MSTLEIKLTGTGGTSNETPCLLIPEAGPDFESYVDIGPGDEPVLARVFVEGPVYSALDLEIRRGRTAIGIHLGGVDFATAFYVAQASIISLGPSNSVMEVKLATVQKWWSKKTVNVILNILGPTKDKFIEGAVDEQTPNTYANLWTNIAAQAGLTFGPLPFSPVAYPINFLCTEQSLSTAIRRVLQPLGLQLVYNIYSDTYSVVAFNYDDSTATEYITSREETTLTDGDVANHENRFVVPDILRVLFPKHPLLEQTITGASPRFRVITTNNPITSGTGTETIYVGTYDVADSALNWLDLPPVAAERCTRFFARANIMQRTTVFIGGHTLSPGSNIRRVRHVIGIAGHRTIVWAHGLPSSGREDLIRSFETETAVRFNEYSAGFGTLVIPRDDGTVDIAAALGARTWNIYQVDNAQPWGNQDSGGHPVQWKYWVYKVSDIKTAEGYAGWDAPRGETYEEGVALVRIGYNLLEYNNRGTGIQMNGIDHDSVFYTQNILFAMAPIPIDALVIGFEVTVNPGEGQTVREVWFFPIPNAEDGSCG